MVLRRAALREVEARRQRKAGTTKEGVPAARHRLFLRTALAVIRFGFGYGSYGTITPLFLGIWTVQAADPALWVSGAERPLSARSNERPMKP
jgi:hypothetical protein